MIDRRDLWDIVMKARGHIPARYARGFLTYYPYCVRCGKPDRRNKWVWDIDHDPTEVIPLTCEGYKQNV